MKKLLLGISVYFLTTTNIVGAADVQRQIQTIPVNPSINNGNNIGGIGDAIDACIGAINALPIFERDALYGDLVRQIGLIAPTYTGIPAYRITIGPNAFAGLRAGFLANIQAVRAATEQEILQVREAAIHVREEEVVVVDDDIDDEDLRPFLPEPRIDDIVVRVDAHPLPLVVKAGEVLQPFVGHLDPAVQKILEMIAAIPLDPEVRSERALTRYLQPKMAAQVGNFIVPIISCIGDIDKLPAAQREDLLDRLALKTKDIKPRFTYQADDDEYVNVAKNQALAQEFKKVIESIAEGMERSLRDAKNPPLPVVEVDDRLDPSPVIMPLVSADTADGLLAIEHYVNPDDHALGKLLGLSGAFEDTRKNAFETRLINYALAHMTAYYKEEAAVWNTELIRVRLTTTFRDVIDATHLLDPVAQRRAKVSLVENLLHDLYANQIGLVPATVDAIETIMDLQGVSQVYTRMEAIKELPSVNWSQVVETYVFDANAALRKGGAETDSAYWRRIGNHVLNIYRTKVKPHICPAGLLADLTANRGVPLVPLHLMYSGTGDASCVFEDINSIRRAGDPGYIDGEHPVPFVEIGVPLDLRETILNFEATAVNLATKNAAFKKNLAQSYQRVEDYIYQTLVKLFGTAHPLREGLSWHWDFGVDFSPQRVELCRKALLTFNYFDRGGDHYLDDIADFAAVAGRFTHCGDGKKTAIEATSTRVLCALSGDEAAIVIEDFDTFLKKVALSGFKQKTIAELSDHPGYFENVSTVAMIRDRNKAFWGDPTDIVPELSPHAYKSSDYGLATDDDLASPNTDRVLQHFYQHIYVAPHELVNVIYTHLKSVDAHKRAGFFGFSCAMLSKHRPFNDLALNGFGFDQCVKEWYCELVAPDDYIFTRKGIETLLFYSGYLAWNGPDDAHPLKVDWEEKLAYLKRTNRDAYDAIYKDQA